MIKSNQSFCKYLIVRFKANLIVRFKAKKLYYCVVYLYIIVSITNYYDKE